MHPTREMNNNFYVPASILTKVLQNVWALGLGDSLCPGVSRGQLLIGDGVMLHRVATNLREKQVNKNVIMNIAIISSPPECPSAGSHNLSRGLRI